MIKGVTLLPDRQTLEVWEGCPQCGVKTFNIKARCRCPCFNVIATCDNCGNEIHRTLNPDWGKKKKK